MIRKISRPLAGNKSLTFLWPVQRLHEIDQSLIPIENVPVLSVIDRAIHNERRRQVRARKGLPPAPGVPLFERNDDPVVEVVESEGYDEFGFAVFRTNYSDADRWEGWTEQFERRLNASLETVSGGKKIKDRCCMPIYVKKELDGANYSQIQG